MTTVKVPFSFKHSVLAAGSETNTTFSLLKKDTVFVSAPYKDLKAPLTLDSFKKDIARKEASLHINPDIIACDLHPEYMSAKYAKTLGAGALVEVQHHHAHIASCMAESGLKGKVIGVAFDGMGYGPDGTIWGGEFLIGGYHSYRRAAHIAYATMPGGDKAVLEPIRMAFSYLYKTYKGNIAKVRTGVLLRLGKDKREIFKNMIDKKINSPLTSSAGRLFDAVASLIGVRDRISFEGEAAIALETIARGSDCSTFYGFTLKKKSGVISIEFGSMVREIISELTKREPLAAIARKFHNTLAEAVKRVCMALRREYGLNRVVLSGGVFQNNILLSGSLERLALAGFSVYSHRDISTSDRGVSLGQAVIAASKTEKKKCA
ncbi:MAG: hypothetical protein V1883_02140 [Candidatus Omnitrophota bacterium]